MKQETLYNLLFYDILKIKLHIKQDINLFNNKTNNNIKLYNKRKTLFIKKYKEMLSVTNKDKPRAFKFSNYFKSKQKYNYFKSKQKYNYYNTIFSDVNNNELLKSIEDHELLLLNKLSEIGSFIFYKYDFKNKINEINKKKELINEYKIELEKYFKLKHQFKIINSNDIHKEFLNDPIILNEKTLKIAIKYKKIDKNTFYKKLNNFTKNNNYLNDIIRPEIENLFKLLQ